MTPTFPSTPPAETIRTKSQRCARILRVAAGNPRLFVTDSEVLQEMMHRYLALGLWELGREVLRAFAEIMHGRIEPVHAEDVLSASEIADRHTGVSTRDLVHAAVMRRLGASRIISADKDFDLLEDLDRLDPARLGEWKPTIPAGEEG